MKRRDFIKNTCAACVPVAALSALATGCSLLSNTSGRLVKDGLVLQKDDFELKDKGNSAYRSFLVIRNDALKYPLCIYRFSDNDYSALWMSCSHQGAELQASGDYLQCPAHGSEFNNRGEATSGPASSSLRSFPVTVSNNEIFIDLRKQS